MQAPSRFEGGSARCSPSMRAWFRCSPEERTQTCSPCSRVCRANKARSRLAEVKEISRLGENLEHPVASYSQGCALAWASPQLRAVGRRSSCWTRSTFDHEYRTVLEEHVHALLAAGGVVVAAGHDHDILGRLCNRAMLLRSGRLAADGPFDDIRHAYVGQALTALAFPCRERAAAARRESQRRRRDDEARATPLR
jgi:hypothetical protein